MQEGICNMTVYQTVFYIFLSTALLGVYIDDPVVQSSETTSPSLKMMFKRFHWGACAPPRHSQTGSAHNMPTMEECQPDGLAKAQDNAKYIQWTQELILFELQMHFPK